MDSRQPVTIVIVTFNSASCIEKCLDLVKQTKRDFDRIVVVDNNSMDNTAALVTGYPDLVLYALEDNIGFTAANNFAIQRCTTPYIVLLNPDAFVEVGWLEKLQGAFGPKIGATGPMSDFRGNEQHIEFKDVFEGSQYIPTKLLFNYCAMYDSSVFKTVGLLDEVLFLGNDDLDYSLRLRDAGYTLLICTEVFVMHKGHHSFSSVKPEEIKRRFRESTELLRDKLFKKYGKHVSAQELWDIDWFDAQGR